VKVDRVPHFNMAQPERKLDPSVSINITENKDETTLYMSELYNIDHLSNDELKLWFDAYSYKGFNREKTISELKKKVPNPKEAQQIILICGLVGPQRASKTMLINGKTISSYGIPASGVKGTNSISCQRIMAATADLCAYFLKTMNAPKRIPNHDCPAWLQFPSAGSITMPNDIRILHEDFSRKFSSLIGGVFNENIYLTMATNSYINVNLKLFTDVNTTQYSSIVQQVFSNNSSSSSSSSTASTTPKPKKQNQMV